MNGLGRSRIAGERRGPFLCNELPRSLTTIRLGQVCLAKQSDPWDVLMALGGIVTSHPQVLFIIQK